METKRLSAVTFPFVHCTVDLHDGEGGSMKVDSWRPGTRAVMSGPESTEDVADGLGTMNLSEVSRHKPGKYPERVFYVRTFTDPDGRTFGKTNLRMTTAQNYRRLCSGHSYPYRMANGDEIES